MAQAYDRTLAPLLFEPWDAQLIDDNKPWMDTNVLDLACGTGVVTKELAKNVGPNGKITALDFSSQMLRLAKVKCKEWINQIDFIEGSADSIALPDNSVDTIVCQQFFPNKAAAAKEIFSVLKPKASAIISNW